MAAEAKQPKDWPGFAHVKVTEEYLRRNLQVARAEGAKANAKSTLAKLRAQKRPPKWLIAALEGIIERVETLPKDLAAYRNLELQVAELESDAQG